MKAGTHSNACLPRLGNSPKIELIAVTLVNLPNKTPLNSRLVVGVIGAENVSSGVLRSKVKLDSGVLLNFL